MKTTLHLYVFREITVPFLLGFAVFTFVLLMGRFINLADMVVAKGVPLTDVLRLLLYMLPSFSFVTIPMAFLLAVLLAFGRISSDNEIIARKAGGIGLCGVLPPVITFAFIAYLATTVITVYALPWGNTAFKTLLYDAINLRVNITLKDGVFNDERFAIKLDPTAAYDFVTVGALAEFVWSQISGAALDQKKLLDI